MEFDFDEVVDVEVDDEEESSSKPNVCMVVETHKILGHSCLECSGNIGRFCDVCNAFLEVKSFRRHLKTKLHMYWRQNPPKFSYRCTACASNDESIFSLANGTCACGGKVEILCQVCSKWFHASGFRHHVASHLSKKAIQNEAKSHAASAATVHESARPACVCRFDFDHVVNEADGVCSECNVGTYVYCSDCDLYCANRNEHNKIRLHQFCAANKQPRRAYRCQESSDCRDFLHCVEKCVCGAMLETQCPDCNRWFELQGFRSHYTRAHVLENRLPLKKKRVPVSSAPAPKSDKKKKRSDEPNFSQDDMGAAMASLSKDAASARAVVVERRKIVTFLQSLKDDDEMDEENLTAVAQILVDNKIDILAFKYMDDDLFRLLELNQPIGIRCYLKFVREKCKLR